MNASINDFCGKCKNQIDFLDKFYKHVDHMDSMFDQIRENNEMLHNFFFGYEKNIVKPYLSNLQVQEEKKQILKKEET